MEGYKKLHRLSTMTISLKIVNRALKIIPKDKNSFDYCDAFVNKSSREKKTR